MSFECDTRVCTQYCVRVRMQLCTIITIILLLFADQRWMIMTRRGCVRACACVDARKVERDGGARRKSHFASGVIYILRGGIFPALSCGNTKQFHVSDTRLIKLITNSSWSVRGGGGTSRIVYIAVPFYVGKRFSVATGSCGPELAGSRRYRKW